MYFEDICEIETNYGGVDQALEMIKHYNLEENKASESPSRNYFTDYLNSI